MPSAKWAAPAKFLNYLREYLRCAVELLFQDAGAAAVKNADSRRPEPPYLIPEEVNISIGGKVCNAEKIREIRYDFQGVPANGSGGPKYANILHSELNKTILPLLGAS